MTSYWQNNLDELQSRHPSLFSLLTDHEHQPVGEIISTPSGLPTLRFYASQEPGPLAYNTEDPWRDAAIHLETVPVGSRALALFVGLGLGYGALRVLAERPTVGMLVIAEPCLDLVVMALRHVDLRPLLLSSKVHWLVGDIDLAALEQTVARIASLEDTHILRHVPSFQWRQEEYTALNHQLFLVVNQLNASGGTTNQAGERFFRNRLANMSLLRHSADLGVVSNLFKNKPAVLVAAGPSLDRSMADLKKVVGRCVMIAVDSALAPLLKAGIMPDFVTTIDFQELNFEKLAPFVGGQWPFSLVATTKVTSLIPKRLSAERLFLAFNDDIPQRWIHDVLGLRELDPSAFSVAHLSLGVALRMGCEPITFIGQDLGYTTGENDHATGTIIMSAGTPTGQDLHHVPGVDGRPVATDRGLLTLQKRFEDMIAAQPGGTYYNATVAGAHIQGTTPRPLAEIAQHDMTDDLPVQAIVAQAWSGRRAFPVSSFVDEIESILQSITKILGQLHGVMKLAKEAKPEIARLLRKRAPIHAFASLPAPLARKLSKFDQINCALDNEQALSDQVLELTYPALSANDRRRYENNELQMRSGYLAWLQAEIKRIDQVNTARHRAFTLYRDLLKTLSQHLSQEKQGRTLFAASPDSEGCLSLARLYANSGDYQLARDMLAQVLTLTPDSVEALLLAGEMWGALLEFDKANLAWQSAIRLAPERAIEVTALRQRQVDFWVAIADEHGNPGQVGDDQFPRLLPIWLERVAAILAHEEEVPCSLQNLWRKHAARMEEWLAIGEISLVELMLRGWQAFGVRFSELLVFQSRHAIATGDNVSAIKDMEMAVARKPGQPQWMAFLARLLLEANRFDEGIARLQEAVALDSSAAVLWEELGDLLVPTDLSGAAIAFERCYLALPERIAALRKLGDCYLRSKQPEAAIVAYEAVLAKCPADEAARLCLAKARRLIQE